MSAERPAARDAVRRGAAATPWLLFAVALILRLYRSDLEPLWFDEAYTALQTSKPVREILHLLRDEAGAPLYYVLLRAWTVVFGDGEWALRLPSALAGAAAAPLLYRVGSVMVSPRTTPSSSSRRRVEGRPPTRTMRPLWPRPSWSSVRGPRLQAAGTYRSSASRWSESSRDEPHRPSRWVGCTIRR